MAIMSLCPSCRVALRQAIRHRRLLSTSTAQASPQASKATGRQREQASCSQPRASQPASSTPARPPIPQTIRDMLSKPSWSVSTLFTRDSSSPSSPSSPAAAPPSEDDSITPAQLHHLLRLSALPLPKTRADEDSMMATIQSQLRFVRAVQEVDTEGVQPLRAIRDETRAALREGTLGLADVRDLLDREVPVGHHKRLKRVKGVRRGKGQVGEQGEEQEEEGEEMEEAAEAWEVMSAATRKAGKYFVVDSGKKMDAGE